MLILGTDGKKRCFGGQLGKEAYGAYHDHEWGVPIYDSDSLFEVLSLEGAQAGLSFETIFKKREAYREAFCNFKIEKVATLSDSYLDSLLSNSKIVRHKGKILSVRENAKIALEMGSLSDYFWKEVDRTPLIQRLGKPISSNSIHEKISKDLKKRGMKFVGPAIIYAFLQATGLINDHLKGCHLC
jgi:DNA-3-methyladenine glycosylase I